METAVQRTSEIGRCLNPSHGNMVTWSKFIAPQPHNRTNQKAKRRVNDPTVRSFLRIVSTCMLDIDARVFQKVSKTILIL